jgi:Protein of unknown function (DUF3311)
VGTERRSWWYLILAVPFVATLFPGFYNHLEPHVFGIPFFYAYQLAWTIGTGILLAIFIAGIGGSDAR